MSDKEVSDVVDFLKNHPKVESVSHPSLPECGCRDLYLRYFPKGAGSIFTFRVKGGEEAAMTFCNRLADLLPSGKRG